MNELLAKILEAHGGTDRSSRWRGSTLPTAMIAPPATSKQVTEQRPPESLRAPQAPRWPIRTRQRLGRGPTE